MPDALLVLVHGSPRSEANDDMFAVLDVLRRRAEVASRFPILKAGFMECNEPSIPAAVDQCAAAGATRVIAVPYFLHTGNHVCGDLPQLLREASARHPAVEFRLGEYIGLSPHVSDLLLRRALSTGND